MTKKQAINLIILPIQFLLAYLVARLGLGESLGVVLLFLIMTLGFIVIIRVNKEDLSRDWSKFKNGIFKKILIGILMALGALLIIKVTRNLIPDRLMNLGSIGSTGGEEEGAFNLFTMVLTSIIPLYAALTEEVIFRKTLIDLGKTRTKKYFFLIVQAILFGLIHLNNFGGNPYRTIPYMFVGLYFGIIYLKTENIFWSILGHLIFNGTLSLLPTIFLIIASGLGLF